MSGPRSRQGARPPRHRTADVRGALVDAAEEVLERDGPAGLTVRVVATEAEVAPMGVYNHFRDKEGLLLAVLSRAFDRLAAATAWRTDVPPELGLRVIGEAYRRLAHERPVAYGLMFAANTSPQTLERIGEPADAAFDGLVNAIRVAQQVGTVRGGDAEVFASAVWSALHGAVSLEISRSLPEAEIADAAFETVLDMIDRALAPVSPPAGTEA